MAAAPTYTTATVNPLTQTTGGALRVDALPLDTAQGAAIGTVTGPLIQAQVTTSKPTYTTATINPLNTNLNGALRVDATGSGSLPVVPIGNFPTTQVGTAKAWIYAAGYGTSIGGNNIAPTTSAYTQIIASTPLTAQKILIFDSSGSGMILALGAAASEVDQIYIPPGGSSAGWTLNIPGSSRLTLKALDAAPTSGYITITALQ